MDHTQAECSRPRLASVDAALAVRTQWVSGKRPWKARGVMVCVTLTQWPLKGMHCCLVSAPELFSKRREGQEPVQRLRLGFFGS